MTVAAELSAALDHSRDGGRVPCVGLRSQKTDSTAVEEEEVHEAYVVPREQKRPLPGNGRHLCLRWPGRSRQSRSVTWLPGCLSWVLAPSMASPSAEAIDESTLSFLLGGNLARVKEEEEEKEAVLARREQALVSEGERFVRSRDRSQQPSNVELVAAAWVGAKTAVLKREKRKKKKKRRKRTRRARFRSCSS